MESKNETDAVNALKAHLALNVTDVTKSIKFYRKFFGIEPSKVRTGYAKFDVQNPPLNFTLNQNAGKRPRRVIAYGNSGSVNGGRAGDASKVE
jgi:catechol 2,3-dioxygenase-like lactoylglutathione lyase family enzyme